MAIVYRFERRDFSPAPRVDVVMLRLRKRGPPLVKYTERQGFRDFIVYSFTRWQSANGSSLSALFTRPQRKYIQHTLGIDLHGSQTYLSFDQWLSLFNYFKTISNEKARQLILGSEKRLVQQQDKLQKIHRTRPPKHLTLRA
jgi:16S rRNA A1518/A1519 N6-dimethyltransferase RsmA/KsgA/DIM1 with predicted DNA glycosylase/AP lyase activity